MTSGQIPQTRQLAALLLQRTREDTTFDWRRSFERDVFYHNLRDGRVILACRKDPFPPESEGDVEYLHISVFDKQGEMAGEYKEKRGDGPILTELFELAKGRDLKSGQVLSSMIFEVQGFDSSRIGASSAAISQPAAAN